MPHIKSVTNNNLEYDYNISNAIGQDMKLNGKLNTFNKVQTIDMSHFSAGNYYVIFRTDNYNSTFKIIKIE